MSDAKEHIARWREAGVLDAAGAERLLAYETREAEEREPGGFSLDREDLPSLTEALLYLGVVILGVGVFALAVQNWDSLQSWARLGAIGIPAALALAAGGAMLASPQAGIQRGGQAAWVLAVALFGGSLAVGFDEYGEWGPGGHGGLLIVAGPTALLAVALWVVSPKHLQVLAIGGTALFLGLAIGNWPDEFDAQLGGMAMLAFAGAALAFAELGLLTPRVSARPVFGVLSVFGPYFAGAGDGPPWAELLVFAVAIALIGLSVRRVSFTYMVVGVVGVFFELISFIVRHFQSEIGAPLALMISGGLVIAGVLILTQLRGLSMQRRGP